MGGSATASSKKETPESVAWRAFRPRNGILSGSHSALPFRPGVLSSLLSYWARTTCHVTYSPDRDATRPGPPTSSRHYGVGPTTTVGADDPCHGASAVPECPRALPVTAGSDGGSRGLTTLESTPTTPVTWSPPCRGTFMVPTVTARLEWRIRRTVQGTDRYRNLTVSA